MPIKASLTWITLVISFSSLKLWAGDCATPTECDLVSKPQLLSNNSKIRTPAIRNCLSQLAVSFPPDTKLYTYGHSGKIKKLQTLPQDEMWAYQSAFQARRETRMVLNIPDQSIKKALPKAQILAAQNYDLAQLLNTYRIKKLEVNSKKLLETDAISFKLAAYSKIYPNLFNQLQSPEWNGEEDRIASPVERAEFEGLQMGDQVQPGFDSTAGTGIYLSQTPTQALDHLMDGEGLACHAPRGKVLINLDNSCVKSILTQAHIYVSENKENIGDQFIMRPQGKNLFVSPTDFEAAAKGFVLAFRPSKLGKDLPPYYVDKKAIHFERSKSECALITIKDFQNCSDFKNLLNFPIFPSFLQTQELFGSSFRSLASKCIQECKSPDEIEILKKLVPLVANKRFFEEIKQANRLFQQCNCRIKQRSDIMAVLKHNKFTFKCIDRGEGCEGLMLKAKSLEDLKNNVNGLSHWLTTRKNSI